MNDIKLYNGDCLDIMEKIEDNSIDLILADLPYGTTACKWDTIIPLDKLWKQYNRIIKENGAILLNAQQPFTDEYLNAIK
jgi:DNA modification methylase